MSEITRRISFGMGVPAQERTDHPVLDAIRDGRLRAAAQARPAGRVAARHGRLGQPLRQPDGGRGGPVWVGVHFGSRGFGHKTASGFLALAQGLPFDGRASEGEMDSPPVLFEVGSELGESYVAAMELAGDYAYAGRDIVVDKVLEILGADVDARGAQPPQLRVAGGALRPHLLGDPEGLHAGPAGPGGLRRRLDGRRVGDPRGRRVGRERAGALLDRARRRPRDEPLAGGRPGPAAQALRVPDRDCDRVFDIDGISSTLGPPKRACARTTRAGADEGLGRRSRSSRAWSTGRPCRRACASRASCSSAAVRTRRRRCTSACRRSSPRTATRSA